MVFTFREEVNAFNESDGLATIIVDKVGLTDQTVVLMVTGRKWIAYSTSLLHFMKV